MGFSPTSLLAPGPYAVATDGRKIPRASLLKDMESTPRLKAGIFVRALIRRVQVAGASAFVVRSGAEEAGAVIIKVAKLDGTVLVLNQVRGAKGELSWAQALGGWTDEARASQWCDKQVAFDPDLWIVEIEDREGRAFVDEPII